MQSFSQQLRIVQRYKVPEGISRRFNCPFCDGNNTLGISNINGKLEWHCFKASCYAKGIYNEGSSIEGIHERLEGSVNNSTGSVGRSIPTLLTNISQPEHIDWLKSVHSYKAYEEGVAPIFYAPAEDRIMFAVNNGIGYTGRRISDSIYEPKWIKYGDTSHLFACGRGPIGVIVEDAPSACAVGVLPEYTGLSLLGTVLTHQHKSDLLKYEKLYVCLDPDAARKGITLAARIDGIRPTEPKIIADDLKYFDEQQIKEMLK